MADSEQVRHFAQLRTLCEGALELPAAARAGWLGRMCEGDESLIAETEELLRRTDEGGILAELLDELEARERRSERT